MKSIPIERMKLCDWLDRFQPVILCHECEYFAGESEYILYCKFEDRRLE